MSHLSCRTNAADCTLEYELIYVPTMACKKLMLIKLRLNAFTCIIDFCSFLGFPSYL